MLQTRLSVTDALPVTAALTADPRLSAAYDAHRALAVALTGAPVIPDLRGARTGIAPPEVALFPAADSPEGELIRALMAEGVDAGDSLLDELIRRVQDGEIDLAPGPRPGWYREKLASLVSLVIPREAPEATRRRTTREYDEYLEALF